LELSILSIDGMKRIREFLKVDNWPDFQAKWEPFTVMLIQMGSAITTLASGYQKLDGDVVKLTKIQVAQATEYQKLILDHTNKQNDMLEQHLVMVKKQFDEYAKNQAKDAKNQAKVKKNPGLVSAPSIVNDTPDIIKWKDQLNTLLKPAAVEALNFIKAGNKKAAKSVYITLLSELKKKKTGLVEVANTFVPPPMFHCYRCVLKAEEEGRDTGDVVHASLADMLRSMEEYLTRGMMGPWSLKFVSSYGDCAQEAREAVLAESVETAASIAESRQQAKVFGSVIPKSTMKASDVTAFAQSADRVVATASSAHRRGGRGGPGSRDGPSGRGRGRGRGY